MKWFKLVNLSKCSNPISLKYLSYTMLIFSSLLIIASLLTLVGSFLKKVNNFKVSLFGRRELTTLGSASRDQTIFKIANIYPLIHPHNIQKFGF